MIVEDITESVRQDALATWCKYVAIRSVHCLSTTVDKVLALLIDERPLGTCGSANLDAIPVEQKLAEVDNIIVSGCTAYSFPFVLILSSLNSQHRPQLNQR